MLIEIYKEGSNCSETFRNSDLLIAYPENCGSQVFFCFLSFFKVWETPELF